jgi:hypothetical protein
MGLQKYLEPHQFVHVLALQFSQQITPVGLHGFTGDAQDIGNIFIGLSL